MGGAISTFNVQDQKTIENNYKNCTLDRAVWVSYTKSFLLRPSGFTNAQGSFPIIELSCPSDKEPITTITKSVGFTFLPSNEDLFWPVTNKTMEIDAFYFDGGIAVIEDYVAKHPVTLASLLKRGTGLKLHTEFISVDFPSVDFPSFDKWHCYFNALSTFKIPYDKYSNNDNHVTAEIFYELFAQKYPIPGIADWIKYGEQAVTINIINKMHNENVWSSDGDKDKQCPDRLQQQQADWVNNLFNYIGDTDWTAIAPKNITK